MIFSGINYRKIQEKKDYNFFLSTSISNTTGSAVFGFSGENQEFAFNFNEGRITDPQGNYVFSYNSGITEISGNVNKENYNYFINDHRVNLSGTKNDFSVDRFFVNSTGCNINLENLIINGSGATDIELVNFNDYIGGNRLITGQVIADSGDASKGVFDIFSGEILTASVTGLFTCDTSFSTGISGTGILGFRGFSGSGIENQSVYVFETKLYTSFGEVTEELTLTGTTPLYFPSLLVTENGPLTSGNSPLAYKTGTYVASYFLDTGAPNFATGLPLSVSLSYYSGHTGAISGVVTGGNLVNSGVNYSSITPPVILVSGNGQGATVTGTVTPEGQLSGISIINGGSGYTSIITNAVLSDSGSGYTGIPEVIISGGNGTGAVIEALTGVPSEVTSGFITGFNVTSGGSGYTQTPILSLQGGGASITGSGEAISSGPYFLIYSGVHTIDVVNSGSGYINPVIELSGGLAAGGASANAYMGISYAGQISGVEIKERGSKYQAVPSVVVKPGITGVNLTFSGQNYTGSPDVIINGEGSGGFIQALTGVPSESTSGYITGFSVVSGGSGYFPLSTTISLDGGGATLTGSGTPVFGTGFEGLARLSSGASFYADLGHYTKEFTGQFNLLTGSGDSYLNFRDAGQISSDNLSYTGKKYIFKENLNLILGVESTLDILVDNFNYYDSLPMVATLFVSGSGADTSTLFVTGVK